ncbi:MAG: bifunctional UDP-N-acetylglucosamine diphosphorylase/glucosamine-1-phosphate N-acetyltransferase GlmU [Peptococcaceae bacterium]|jgi:bifunctional UDP-N-acetylglucosamine pyrophosphorylase/glucosamine-1-phosphate N-acetyltransferase|nr:bifunctional UDP-N-acetylglucosamine diphosphorylase/glucosamine-1-phosphate N-acetyltransferase GlmU [Peptococcaceae bacterium]
MSNIAAVIMAAGKGARMKSRLPKVMHRLAGKPLIDHVLDLTDQLGIDHPLVILGHGRALIEEHVRDRAVVVTQTEQLGTGHAVRQALPGFQDAEDVLVLSGDQPLLCLETMQALLALHQEQKAVATVLTAQVADPFGYGRVIRDGARLLKIVEEKDATEAERAVREINTGTYCFNVEFLTKALPGLTPQNAQGEYYLTGVFDFILADGLKALTYCTRDVDEALGINSRIQLAEAEQIFRRRILHNWLEEGVTIEDPATVYIESDVVLSRDVTLRPFVYLKGTTVVEENSVIGPQVDLESCFCGAGSELRYTVAREVKIGKGCTIGPFAYLRPGTELADGVKVGDFVEIKKSRIGSKTKIPHLSYIGDAEIGADVNIGAGTITCNYDGEHKHLTRIADGVFIGSNANLVAPVEIGAHAFVGAGSTITEGVPAEALVVERGTLRVRKEWRKAKTKAKGAEQCQPTN